MIQLSDFGFYMSVPCKTDMADAGRFRNDEFLPLYFEIQTFNKSVSLLFNQVNFFKDLNNFSEMINIQQPLLLSYQFLEPEKVQLLSTNPYSNPQPYCRHICNNTGDISEFRKDTLYFFPKLLYGSSYEGYDIKSIVKFMFDRSET
jgi:hypothetical protein